MSPATTSRITATRILATSAAMPRTAVPTRVSTAVPIAGVAGVVPGARGTRPVA